MSDALEPDPSDGEARLRAVLDTAADGIITIDESGIIESANPATERIFGYSVAELTGQNVRVLMPSPYREEHDQYLHNYRKTGERKIIGIGREVWGRRKDGSTFPMYLSVSELQLGDRRVFTGIVHNLEELRHAEQQAAQFGRVLDDSLNEIYIFDAETLKFEQVNRGARENLGYSQEELIKLTPIDLKPDFTWEEFADTVAPLRSGEVKSVQFETVHKRKNETLYPVDVHVQLSNVGEKPVFVAIILDITERHKRDQTIQQERDFASGLINTAHAIVMVLDLAGRIVQFNQFAQELTGYTFEEARGADWFAKFLPERERERIQEVFDRAVAGERVEGVVNAIVKRDGGECDIMWFSRATHDADQNVTGVLAIGHDITDLRSAQRQLVQSERLAAIGQMVTGLAHESRNALQRASAGLDMLALELSDQPEQLELTRRSRAALDDLHRLYEEVKHYAAPIQLERQVCNVSDIWRKVWRDLQVVPNGRAAELDDSTTCDAEMSCRIDRYRIEQVFRNIFENSLAVCPEPGRVTIACRNVVTAGQPAVCVSVRDNGPGMSPEAAENIFQPFFTTKQKGTGLGMAITKRIVEAHGGTIAIGQAEPGAEIVITLPK